MTEFVNGEEGREFYFSQCEYPIDDFEHSTTIKVFPGQTFIVYNYDFNYCLNILAVVDVTNITVNKKDGVRVLFKDFKTGETFNVSHVPVPMAGHEVFAYVPQRVMIERTLLRKEEGGYFETVAAAIVLMHRTKDQMSLEQDYAMPLAFARRVNLGDGELDQLCADKGYQIKRW